jgi:hypothetical protein
MTITANSHLAFAEAYLRMARELNYRPGAPGDGFGSVDLDEEQLANQKRLEDEAVKFARRFRAAEDDHRFQIGISHSETHEALVFLIQAARESCGSDITLALDLSRTAVAQLEEVLKKRKERVFGPKTGE